MPPAPLLPAAHASRRGAAWRGLTLVVLAGLAAAGCSNKQKKLSTGGGLGDSLFYDVLGQKRDPSYYYALVRDSHDKESFCYRCGTDVYLVDKNVDAIQHLGDGPFARLEGQANTIVMLTEVAMEDPSTLARSAAAVSLTKIGLTLPRYAASGPEDDGSGLAAALGELTSIYGAGDRSRPATLRDRTAQVVRQIGEARYRQGLYTKKALQFLGTHEGLVNEADPVVRGALDAALTKKSREAVVYALLAAVEGPADHVRADAIRGLKALGEAGAVAAVVERVVVEASPRVRAEAAEYFGRIATREATAALVPLLEDADGGVRWKARAALTRIAGQDLGPRRLTWSRWALSRWPDLRIAPRATPGDEPAGP